MRRRIIALGVVFLLLTSLPIYAMAYSSRTLAIMPGLNFEGTTAKCSLSVSGYSSTDSIEAVIKLWDGNNCLETWTKSGTGFLMFNDTHRVNRNREYTLTVDVEINDISKPTVSISKRCE